MRQNIEKQLSRMKSIAINIDEMEVLINPNSNIKRSFELLIKKIYKLHADDAIALQKFFEESLLNRMIEVIEDVEMLLYKYRNLPEGKFNGLFSILNVLRRALNFTEDLIRTNKK